MSDGRRRRRGRVATASFMIAAVLLGACSSASETVDRAAKGGYESAAVSEVESEALAAADAAGVAPPPVDADAFAEPKMIRDGRVELRVDPGAFGQATSRLRSIARDLGGSVTAGETYLEEIDGVKYTVGWTTIRVPQDRFDDAVDRVNDLGEQLSMSLSTQDVTEEYVDLEGRLRFWKTQEEFYTRLMAEASEIEDLVTIQTRMEDVLLNVEQIEGRMRYLDARVDFSTLTVGLTEIPEATGGEWGGAGVIGRAFERAGSVLLTTIAWMIVGAAALLPFVFLAMVVFGLWMGIRAVVRRRRDRGGSVREDDGVDR